MAFDTKYRPLTYDEVLGQDATVEVLRQFVREGRGFHQSYVFCGQHGSGKTTLGRILARSLLCENPQEGGPCDSCTSCISILEKGASECFVELDAATKSGKADVAKIVEDIGYATFSGKRCIYLFDEAHRLSKQALDALLKPMEDCVQGVEDKQLVCIFATTEPDKMRSTIFSRCAPAFVIRQVSSKAIGERLAQVCSQEGLEYELPALELIADHSESHIRDALKMVEGVSMVGPVTTAAVSSYLRLDANQLVWDLLQSIKADLPMALLSAKTLSDEVSPSVAYERIAAAALLAYETTLGVGKVPRYWDEEQVAALGSSLGEGLLPIAEVFAAPPRRPTRRSLVLDVARSHHGTGVFVAAPGITPAAPSTQREDLSLSRVGTVDRRKESARAAHTTKSGVFVDPRAVGSGTGVGKQPVSRDKPPTINDSSAALEPHVFQTILQVRLAELRRQRGRFSGRNNMGGS